MDENEARIKDLESLLAMALVRITTLECALTTALDRLAVVETALRIPPIVGIGRPGGGYRLLPDRPIPGWGSMDVTCGVQSQSTTDGAP